MSKFAKNFGAPPPFKGFSGARPEKPKGISRAGTAKRTVIEKPKLPAGNSVMPAAAPSIPAAPGPGNMPPPIPNAGSTGPDEVS